MDSSPLYYKDPQGGSIKKLIPIDLTEDEIAHYPGDRCREKPRLSVIQVPNFDKAYSSVKSNFRANTLVSEETLAFLVEAMPLFPLKLEEDWSSYGLSIGKAGETVNPQHLLTIERNGTPGEWSDKDLTPCTPDKARSLVGLILSLYRLGKIKDTFGGGYKTEDRIYNTLTTAPFVKILDKNLLVVNSASCAGWTGYLKFRMVVGAYDMFMHYRDQEYSPLRIATITTAWEDCTGLTSYSYFCKKLGINTRKAAQYMMHVQLGKDIEKLWKPDQEIGKKGSYFTHFRSLNICAKSPYSSQSVGFLYNVIHSCCGYLGDPRSLNAVVMLNNSPNEMIILGGYLGDAFLTKGSFARIFYEDPEDAADQEGPVPVAGPGGSDDPVNDEGDDPRDPNVLLNKMTGNGFELTPEHKARFLQMGKTVPPRKGSFSDFFLSNFGT